ncbi:ImmA/IrrE family metallo-endopeptidase [Vibrio alginolyticus]|uniref:ImmA/IrrE family metallo-endopeptidase n=1 Tax=Vibrio alginolyticus TaxID=663 RepID=UPI001EEBB9BC|nr:ImmA/IrrE family metallo-endopeptidase [Vibrio alginolyticus]MCG6316669.1 ImmA/IrrE family metallo-endopeptidase [Vibrio alginolyticus]
MMSTSKEWHRLTEEQKATILKYQQEIPVKLGSIAKEFGIEVKRATLSANISGQIQEKNGKVTIKVNRHDVKARQRYTLSHEISHFLLHRHLLTDGITDDLLYRSAQSNLIEYEAERLAADIIMPMTQVARLIKKHSETKKGALLLEAIAEELEVSTTALGYRIDKK